MLDIDQRPEGQTACANEDQLSTGRDKERREDRGAGDLDLRVLSLHLFCRGFSRQPIEPGTPLWTELNRLREFRNDLLHGNLTEEHRIHTLVEGAFVFWYAPSREDRGPAREKQMRKRIARSTFHIDEKNVTDVQSVVDEVRFAVVDALEPRLQEWVRSWIDDDVVMPPPGDA
jgi:hypothetical protein